jgi:hypothetical protein
MIDRFILNLIALKSLIILSLSVNILNGGWMCLMRVILTDCRLMESTHDFCVRRTFVAFLSRFV